jgi:hypothetical protein
MQIIRNPAETANIADPDLRALIEKTMHDLSPDGPYDPAVLGDILVLQLGDSLSTLSEKLGFDAVVNIWTRIRFGDAGFTPSFELVDEHPGYFELIYVIGQDGWGFDVFIPKTIDLPELLEMCRRYATPAPTVTSAV